ncbi:MAG: DUF1385 domain-containing protein [Candidatus Delongbacteria bacterium]|nr:DUF1385 domain-containing protein [Candidatus Delongbacteria bacterium]MBN2835753.1 DUF1385 domain-containing protein [Candidatus Delongbacteria bacterium]
MKKINIGGQAVIEGIMMRSPEYVSTVIRRADGSIENMTKKSIPITKRYPFLNIFALRGFISLVETLKIGVSTLSWSGDKAIEDDKKKEGKEVKEKTFFGKLVESVGTVFALFVGLVIFMYIPYLITNYALKSLESNQFIFNILAGFIRIFFLISYMYVISMFDDVKRVFQYHGAEHKAIYCYEKGLELTVQNVKKESRFHPRCGTSFILIVAINTIILFAILDTIIVSFYGDYSGAIQRVLVHLLFIPLVAGLSFEILKLSDKFSHIKLVGLFIKPGLWLQHITTQEPDENQIEVGIKAIELSTEYLRS